MAVERWQPGKLYQPDAVVQDVASGVLAAEEVVNGGFELGDQDWTKGTGWTIENVAGFSGSWRASQATGSFSNLEMDQRATVDAGITRLTAQCFVQASGIGNIQLIIRWRNAGDGVVGNSLSVQVSDTNGGWQLLEVSGIAPEGAVSASLDLLGSNSSGVMYVDDITWDYARLSPISEVIFKAIQAAGAFSDTSEPVWPTVVGNTVVDGGVTWEAVQANRVVWTCSSVLTSGASEPTFPTDVGSVVADSTIGWEAFSRRVTDPNCPNSKQVAILASKVFAGDDDIVGYSATVNPLDWTSSNDAGFIPFGLNTYGSQPVSALGIYRGNLVAFNSKAFQMWQVDEDPANFAILDAVPVGCPYFKSPSPVSNDLVFLSPAGIRSMGIAGASTNLQAGFFGKQVDPLVKEALANIGDLDDIISLFYPGAGQYWLIFGAEAFVLTLNGGKSDMSWGRYTFPSAIDDWTIAGTDLYLRSGDLVWKFDPDVLVDDAGGTDTPFVGRIWWHYLDFSTLAVTKQMHGFDVVADGTFSVSIGYNQNDRSQFTPPYTIEGDTLTGDVIPLPVSAPSLQFRLEFAGNQEWEWSISTLYLQDFRRTS